MRNFNDKSRFAFYAACFVCLIVLTSCNPLYANLKSDTRIVKEGGRVTLTVTYGNTSDKNYSDSYLEIEYDEDLIFLEANPAPQNLLRNVVRWSIGDLSAGEKGMMQLIFEVASSIDQAKYEIPVRVYLSGKGGGASEFLKLLIEGHPTPTPLPTVPPSPTRIVPQQTEPQVSRYNPNIEDKNCEGYGNLCSVHPEGCDGRGENWMVTGRIQCVNGKPVCKAKAREDYCDGSGGIGCGGSSGTDCSSSSLCAPGLVCATDGNSPTLRNYCRSIEPSSCTKIPDFCWTKDEVGQPEIICYESRK